MKDKFKQDIEKFKDEVDEKATKLKRVIARAAFRKIMERSPVWTGAYVKSHNVGISKTGAGRGISRKFVAPSPIMVPKMNPAEADALKKTLLARRIAYISRAQLHDVITISNSAPHAALVEYIGWKKTPAYHVYGLTYQEMLHFTLTGMSITASGLHGGVF